MSDLTPKAKGALPYTLVAPPFPWRVELATPTEICRRVLEGKFHAALLPVARLNEVRHLVKPAGLYGVACKGPVHSVKLFSRKPIQHIILRKCPIFITEKSQTSRALLRILVGLEYKVEPVLTTDKHRAQAFLLIGDDALQDTCQTESVCFDYDLGAWWHRLTGLPFVFAQWVVRHDLNDEAKAAVSAWIEDNVALAESPEGARLMQSASSREYSLAFLNRYFQNIRPRLNNKDMRGMEVFLELLQEEERCVKIA